MQVQSAQHVRLRALRLILPVVLLLLAAASVPALAAPAAPAAQVNIEFDGLPQGFGAFPTPYQEGGFTMTSADLAYSNVLPGTFEAYVVPFEVANATGTLEITETDASAFEFISLVLSTQGNSSDPVSLALTGYSGASVVGTELFQMNQSFTPITFSASNLAGKSIDRLSILFTGTFDRMSPGLFSIRLENAPCPASPWNVATEAELNFAIGCFNAVTAPGSYTINVTQNISLTASTTAIDNATTGIDLVINGGGFAVDGQGTAGVRPFSVAANTRVSINEATVTGGNATGNGGAILNEGTLTITASTLAGNRASEGSAIENTGTLSMVNSTVSGNTASTSSVLGGAVYISSGSGALDSVTVANNLVPNNPLGVSGVVFAAGTTGSMNNTIADAPENVTDFYCVGSATVTFNRNLFGVIQDAGIGSSCDAQTGNIVGQSANLGPLANNGGPTQTHLPNAGSPAVDAGDTTLTFDQRGIARPQGAADDIGAVEVEGVNCSDDGWPVGTEVELNAAIACYNAKTVSNLYPITLTQSISLTASTTVISNTTPGVALEIIGNGFTVDGQGISGVRPFEIATDTNVNIGDMNITGGNTPTDGGGIRLLGTLFLTDSTLSDNQTTGSGGGIYIEDGELAASRITLTGNSAGVTGGGLYQGGQGSLKNSTISGNSAGGFGGGLVSATGGSNITIDSVTIVDNSAPNLASGIRAASGGSINIRNSIVANNTGAPDCGVAANAGVIDNGYNLVESPGTCASSLTGTGTVLNQDPVLGPLADNGGSTQTHLPQAASPAIDAGNTTLDTDQRGVDRPQGSADDIGAVEVCAPPAAPAVGIARSGTQVQLSWTGTADVFDVFRSSNQPYFTPAAPPYAGDVSSPWLDPDTTSIGDVANNYFYVLQARSTCGATADGNRVGEFDFTLVPGTP